MASNKITINLPSNISVNSVWNMISNFFVPVAIPEQIDVHPNSTELSDDVVLVEKEPSPTYVVALKKKLTEPFVLLVLGSIGFLSYVYLANDFICQTIGLYYPSYQLYKQFNSRSPNRNARAQALMKYFYIYSHVEFASYPLRMIGMPLFHHTKIFGLLYLIYLLDYRPDLLNSLYDKTVKLDAITWKYANEGLKQVATALPQQEVEPDRNE